MTAAGEGPNAMSGGRPGVALSVLLSSFNRAESLRRVLGELDRQVVPAGVTWEVLAIDNASTDHTSVVTAEAAAARPDRFRALHEPKKGKSNALNLALSEARGAILAFTDDDVLIPPTWVAGMVAAFADPRVAGVGGRVLPAFQSGRPTWTEDLSVRWMRGPLVCFDFGDQPRRLDVAPFGANMAFRADVFRRHGGFRPDLGPAGGPTVGGEDVEMGGRVLAAGETMMYAPDAVLSHPAESHRLNKKYFETWWFRHGRTSVLLDGDVTGPGVYFGVPRYLVRSAAESAVRSLVGRDEKQRLYARLAMMEALGKLSQRFARNRAAR